MSTAFHPLALPPGVVTNPTKAMNATNYAEVNMVRWGEPVQGGGGELQPIGGQSQYKFTFASRCKAVHGWFGLDQIYRVAYLCESNLYVDVGGNGNFIEITPTGGLKLPISLTEGGYSDGLYNQGVHLNATAASTTASPSITMVANPENLVQPGVDVFDVTTGQHIGVVQSYTGTALVLTANAASASQGAADLLNFGAYNEPRGVAASAAIDRLPDAYSLDNFGAVLLAMTSADARLLFWDPASAPGTLAAPVVPKTGSTVPLGRCFVVTPERFVQIFGAYNDGTTGTNTGGSFRRFSWCEQEDYTNWSYSDLTTQAGFMDIEPGSPIVCAISTRSGTLFFTAKKAYRSRYLGTPYVYSLDELGDNCTPWSPQSMANTSSMVLWFSQQGCYSYDGTSILPVQCSVWGWVNDDIDILNVREQACAVHVANYNEFWWCFPQGSSSNPNGYNTRAIIYNYKSGWWSQARIARSAGVTASYTSHTIMANGTVAYQHEYGNVYWDCDKPWVETFDLNVMPTSQALAFQGVAGGGKLTTIKQMIPDINGATSNVLYSLFYRNTRSLGDGEMQTTPRPVRSNGYVDFRTTGRDLRLRIDLAGASADGSVLPVTLGQHLIDAVMRSDR